jgi:filamentous hemagglutinin family protein
MRIVLLVLCLWLPTAHAEITLQDGTALSGPDFDIGEALGQRSGNNLFHSFDQFNLNAGEKATFSGRFGIENVISRISGGESTINGMIISTIPFANLFFLNPAGFVFGDDEFESLDVNGSFYLSTADYLRFNDGSRFSVNDVESSFSSAEPAAFGFAASSQGSITLNGTYLSVNDNKRIGLVGGDINLNPGDFNAAWLGVTGEIQIQASASSGEVSLTGQRQVSGGTVTLNETVVDAQGLTAKRGGDILIAAESIAMHGAKVQNTGNGTGSIQIHAEQGLTIDQQAYFENITYDDDSNGIRLSAPTLSISGDSTLLASTSGDGQGGHITINAPNNLNVAHSNLNTDSSGTGAAGNISIQAGNVALNQVEFSSVSNNTTTGAIHMSADSISANASKLNTSSVGASGDVSLNAATIGLSNDSLISTVSERGQTGNVSLNGDNVYLDNSTVQSESAGGSVGVSAANLNLQGATVSSPGAAYVSAVTANIDNSKLSGNPLSVNIGRQLNARNSELSSSGTLSVNTAELNLLNSQLIGQPLALGATTFNLEGQSHINTSGDLSLILDTPLALSDGNQINSEQRLRITAPSIALSGAALSAATLDISTGAIDVQQQGVLSATTLLVKAETIVLADGSSAVAQNARYDIAHSTRLSDGAALVGNTELNSPQITLDSAAQIVGDQVTLNADALRLDDSQLGAERLQVTVADTQLSNSQVSANDTLQFDGDSLNLENSARISSITDDTGEGADIDIRLRQNLTAQNQDFNSAAFTGIVSTTASEKTGGIVSVAAPHINLAGNSGIVAETTGAGDAGHLAVSSDNLTLNNGARLSTSSDGSGSGGILTVHVGTLHLNGIGTDLAPSRLVSSSLSEGQGGSIEIQAGEIRLTDQALIEATARAGGNAGTIIVEADTLILHNGASINSSSAASASGKGGDITANVSGLLDISGETPDDLGATKKQPSAIGSSAFGSGDGGSLNIQAGEINMDQRGTLQTLTRSDGDAGDIRVRSRRLTILNGADIDASNEGTGAGSGGDVTLDIAGDVEIGAERVDQELFKYLGGVYSYAESSGSGGSVSLAADNLTMHSGGTISAASDGIGNAGEIRVKLRGPLAMREEANITGFAREAGGGNIVVETPARIQLKNASITARAEGLARQDSGGNVTISNGEFFIMDKSTVLASAVGGDGGNITITTESFIPSSESIVDASSELGVDGTVTINAPDTHLAESLMQAPQLLNARVLLQSLCRVRDMKDLNRLAVNMFRSVGAKPDDWLASTLPEGYLEGVDWIKLYQRACHLQQGDNEQRLREWLQSLPAAAQTPAQKALLLSFIGDVWMVLQQYDESGAALGEALKIVDKLGDHTLSLHVLNNTANWYAATGDYSAAEGLYVEALDKILALKQTGKLDEELNTIILLNLARTELRQGYSPYSTLSSLQTQALPPIYALSLAHITTDNKQKLFWLNQALQDTEDNWQRSYALGWKAKLYAAEGRQEKALQYAREAVFAAQQHPALMFRWQALLADLLWQAGEVVAALQAHQTTVTILTPIRASLAAGTRDVQGLFHQQIRPVYYNYADALLQRAAQTQGAEHKALLQQSLDVQEQFKMAELQDYFKDACVARAQRQQRGLRPTDLNEYSAVLYPLVLENRTELLLLTREGIEHMTVPLKRVDLERLALDLRRGLQTIARWGFVKPSRELYDWLIAPLRKSLDAKNIDTLVIVPDGVLRLIPFSTLLSDKHYLIEDFAIAITPSLRLTDNTPISRDKVDILLNGVSDAVQNFSALPSVPKEVENIRAIYDSGSVLLNQDFVLPNLRQSLQTGPYEIVHIASHGQFERDPDNTFLLAYDSKLTMDHLEELLYFSQLRKEPIELLTLSACQTAVGDERAALGLAGVAIKAGARSALASLWFVNDEATSKLIVAFYENLQNPEVKNKAEALRLAQKALIKDKRLRHPAYWAPFMVIGNWL